MTMTNRRITAVVSRYGDGSASDSAHSGHWPPSSPSAGYAQPGHRPARQRRCRRTDAAISGSSSTATAQTSGTIITSANSDAAIAAPTWNPNMPFSARAVAYIQKTCSARASVTTTRKMPPGVRGMPDLTGRRS